MGTTNFDDIVLADLGATSLATLLAALGASEIAVLDGVVAGTVSASKAVVVDSNKDITGFRALTTTGNTVLGDAAGDTFKVHGTAGSGAQSAFQADLGAFTDPPSAAEMSALRTFVNNMNTCLINHGLMAAS